MLSRVLRPLGSRHPARLLSASTRAAQRVISTSSRNTFLSAPHTVISTSFRPSAKCVSQLPSRGFASLPEHIKLTMPALSPTMTQGNLVEWKVKVGDHVKPGTLLANIETDKATVGFESVEEGYIAQILVPAGSADVPVNKLLAILVESTDQVAAFKDFKGDSGSAPAAAASSSAAAPSAPSSSSSSSSSSAPSSSVSSDGRVVASPLARTLAKEKGVDLRQVQGTGPNNRIIAADVREFQPAAVKAEAPAAAAQVPRPAAPATPAPAPPVPASSAGSFTDIPLTNVRKVIAQRLLQSKQNIPHYYLTIECVMDEVIKTRALLNAKLEDKDKLSVNDFIIKASALALRKVPTVNSSWLDTAVRQYNYVDVSVAVATPTGLITPIIKDADLKGLGSISNDMKRLAAKAKENKLQPDEFIGGTFTISNLGMFGIKNFSAIINPPQSCILAVGAAESRVLPNEGKNAAEVPFKTSKVMSVTMSCDHRVVDGAVGAQWLQAFKSFIENPLSMLL